MSGGGEHPCGLGVTCIDVANGVEDVDVFLFPAEFGLMAIARGVFSEGHEELVFLYLIGVDAREVVAYTFAFFVVYCEVNLLELYFRRILQSLEVQSVPRSCAACCAGYVAVCLATTVRDETTGSYRRSTIQRSVRWGRLTVIVTTDLTLPRCQGRSRHDEATTR